MEIQLEIEREEARRRRNERKDSYNEELEGLHQMMSQVGRKKEGAPLLVEEFSDDDLDMEGLTALEIDYDEKIVRVGCFVLFFCLFLFCFFFFFFCSSKFLSFPP